MAKYNKENINFKKILLSNIFWIGGTTIICYSLAIKYCTMITLFSFDCN
jgi:hypothetical protein